MELCFGVGVWRGCCFVVVALVLCVVFCSALFILTRFFLPCRYNNIHEILHNRAILLKFSMRMKNSHLISSFGAWHHHAKERVHVRHTMIKYLNAITRAGEVQAMEQLKKYSLWYERHAHEQDHHQLTQKINSLENELHSCQNELEEFRAVFNRKRDKFVLALQARVTHQRIRKCVRVWRSMAHSRHSARRTISRLLNKQLSSAWHSWLSHDAALREDNKIHSMALAERSRERDRKKEILNRTLKHMQQSKLSSIFRTWKGTVAEMVHERFILNRFVSRWKNMDLHRNFLSWVSFTEMILHQKATARKVMNRIALKQEVAAWHQWTHAIQMLRQYDMEAQEVARKKQHDDVVLERFVRRWKSLEIHDRFARWKQFWREAQEVARKKLHDDVVLERFVRRWKSLELHNRFVRWKQLWRHEKHTRETQDALAQLRSEYETKIGGMQAARDLEQAHRVRKALAAWLNNNLSHCYHRWRELTSRNIRERNVVAKFVLHWQKSSLVTAYRSWVYKVRHVKRSRRIVANHRASRGRQMMIKLFRVWVTVSRETAKDRRLLKRFGQRWRNMGLTRVWLSWHEFIELRKHARELVNMFFGRWTNQNISKGFRAWNEFCVRYDTHKMSEQLKTEAMRQRQKAASVELEAKQASAKRMLRHMMQRHLSATFRTWQENVAEMLRVRRVMQNFALRMTKSGMVKAFGQWTTFIDDRNLARKVLNQMLHRKIHGAWKTWVKYSIWISKWTADAAVKKVEELTLALNRIRTRSVKTLLWDRYKEIMGTAMHAWYLTIVHDRENEHKRHDEEEHQRLEEALRREAAEHSKYEEAMAKGASQEEALANLEKGLEDVRKLTAAEHAKYEQARTHELEEHKRLEAALEREAVEHAKYEKAVAQGACQKEALVNLEKGLTSARQVSAEEHKKYEAAKLQLETKVKELAEKPKGHLSRALISSVWHKHKSQTRAKNRIKKTRATSTGRAATAGNESAWSVARAGVRGFRGIAGRKSPPLGVRASPTALLSASTSNGGMFAASEQGQETNGRAVQRKLEELNEIVHTLTTATGAEQQCTLLRALSNRILRADNVDLFIRGKNTFWTTAEGLHVDTKEEQKGKMHAEGNHETWPLNEKGGMVAVAILQGHIIDSENALMDNLYQPSPDLSPSGVQSRATTLAVLVVPLMDKHGQTIGALRASRGKSSQNASDSFSSVDSLLMCILAAVVQCTWNFGNGSGSSIMGSSEYGDETRSKMATPADSIQSISPPPHIQTPPPAWEAILRHAITEFDRSHATVIKRLSNVEEKEAQQHSIESKTQLFDQPGYQQQYQQPQQQFQSLQQQPPQHAFQNYHAFQPVESGLNVNDLSYFTPSYRPGETLNRGVVSFVHQEY